MVFQRCIWTCLANTPGAASPEYGACVEENCNETEEQQAEQSAKPIQQGQRGNWTIHKLSIDEPPYYDGYAANTQSSNGKMWLSFVCGKGGDKYISISGSRVDALSLAAGQSKRVTFSFDRDAGMDLDLGEYEGAIISDMLPTNHQVIRQMQSSNRLNIRFGSHFETFSLKGSSWALNIALDYCR